MNRDDYLGAVGVVNELLSDWQNYRGNNAMALLTPAAKRGHTPADLTAYFAGRTDPTHAGYEVAGYRAAGSNEFDFQVWMHGTSMGEYGGGNTWARSQPQTVTVVREKGNWLINNLPGMPSHVTNVKLASFMHYMHYQGTIYNNPNYLREASEETVTFYSRGNVDETALPFVASPSSHSPWRQSTVLTSTVLAANLAPNPRGWQNAEQTVGHEHVRAVDGAYTMEWQQIRITPQSPAVPAEAIVKMTVNKKAYLISLYRPFHRFSWIIYKIVAER